jgi:hypothetical protein
MQNNRILFLRVVILILMFSDSNIFCKGSSAQIQLLYSKISNELLSIRKEYPNAQPKVYTSLDQVCKMYSTSKGVIDRKKQLKKNLTNEKNLLRVKNLSLMQKLKNTEGELDSTKQNESNTSRSIEQKDILIAQLKKEKDQLVIENKKISEEKRQLLLKAQNHSEQQINPEQKNLSENQNEIYLHKMARANGKPQKITFNDFQNFNLTSTSEPISPV